MAKSKGLSVTAGERVLIHLRRYNKYRGSKSIPPDVTQEGISQAADVRITHVPRTIKKLKNALPIHLQGEFSGKGTNAECFGAPPWP